MIIKKASDAKKEGNLVCIIYGPPGVGKTTMVQTLDKPLLIDLERGYTVLDKDIDVAICDKWSDITEALVVAVTNGYRSVAIDSLSRMLDYLTDEILAKYKIAKLRIQDYGEISKRVMKILWDLKTKYKLNVVLIAHETEEKDEDGGSIYVRPSISPKSLLEKMPGVVDLLGRMVVCKDGKRLIFSQPTEKYKAKSRIKKLQNPCEPDFGGILKAYSESINCMSDQEDEGPATIKNTMMDTEEPDKTVPPQLTTNDEDPLKKAVTMLKAIIKTSYSDESGQAKYKHLVSQNFGVDSAARLNAEQVTSLCDILQRSLESATESTKEEGANNES